MGLGHRLGLEHIQRVTKWVRAWVKAGAWVRARTWVRESVRARAWTRAGSGLRKERG